MSLTSCAHAIDFNHLSSWSADERYRRGDVVRLQNDMSSSVIPSRGRSPASSDAVYRYETVEEWIAHTLEIAVSQGSYFNDTVRAIYPYGRLE